MSTLTQLRVTRSLQYLQQLHILHDSFITLESNPNSTFIDAGQHHYFVALEVLNALHAQFDPPEAPSDEAPIASSSGRQPAP